MNTTYPRTSADFDYEFLTHTMKAIFTIQDLRVVGQSSTIKYLPRAKRGLAKGVLHSRIFKNIISGLIRFFF